MNTGSAVVVRDLHKGFVLRDEGADTFKERVLGSVAPGSIRRLEVLRGLDLEIGRGEFFGITGRNGSGKSTLLKLLAGIYRADRGSIEVAGTVAPFIDLGVGFHPELSAPDNVVLNSVLMGLTEEQARERRERVIEFAGLAQFRNMKLRRYSSGMRVRLGFSVLVHSDARVLLLDEVLAVGDAAFQHQCEEAFERLIGEGRTIVLVTHSMGRIEQFCDRALVLEDGLIETIGPPAEVSAAYERLAIGEQRVGPVQPAPPRPADAAARPSRPAAGSAIAPGASESPRANTTEAPSELITVKGPSMLGDDARRFPELLKLIARTEFKLRYHGSIAGYAWSLISPLILFGILYLVFTRIIRFGGDVENYPAVLLLNVMLFRFFVEASQGSVASLVQREALVRKTRLPRLAVPLGVVGTAAIGLALNLLVVLGYILVYGVEPRLTWLLMPVIVGLLVTFTSAVAMILSAVYVRARDVAQIWAVATTGLLYLTPVLYPIEVAPQGIRDALLFNPLALILELARLWIIDPNAPGPVAAAGSWLGVVGPIVVFIATCGLAYRIFSRENLRLAEDL